MNYLILFLVIIICSEILFQGKYIFSINSLVRAFQKSFKIVISKKISDHWKEKIIPQYSLKMIQLSLNILIKFLTIFMIFFIAKIYFVEFFKFFLSFKSILLAIILSSIYYYVRNILSK